MMLGLSGEELRFYFPGEGVFLFLGGAGLLRFELGLDVSSQVLERIVVVDDAAIGKLEGLVLVSVETDPIWWYVEGVDHDPLLADDLGLDGCLARAVEHLLQR